MVRSNQILTFQSLQEYEKPLLETPYQISETYNEIRHIVERNQTTIKVSEVSLIKHATSHTTKLCKSVTNNFR